MSVVKFLIEVVSNDTKQALIEAEEREYVIPNYSADGIKVDSTSSNYRLMYAKMQYVLELQEKVRKIPEIYYDLLYGPGLIKKNWCINVVEV